MKAAIVIFVLKSACAALGWLAFGQIGAIGAVFLSMGFHLWVFWYADRAIIDAHKARAVFADDASPVVRAFVADALMLARKAGVGPPKTFIVDLSQPNAFVVGRDATCASVIVTTGLLQTLTRSEAQAVLAHELAYLKRGDALTMAIVWAIAAILARFVGVVGALVGKRQYVSGLMARLISRLSASRIREYAADKAGGEVCGAPLQLARALEKIARSATVMRNPVVERHPATAHLYVLDPLVVTMGPRGSTHPAPEQRVARLRRQAALAAIRRCGADALEAV